MTNLKIVELGHGPRDAFMALHTWSGDCKCSGCGARVHVPGFIGNRHQAERYYQDCEPCWRGVREKHGVQLPLLDGSGFVGG